MLDRIKGVFIIAQTPFDDDGAVDLESVGTLTDFYLRHGADGLTVLGVSGEGGKLGPEEALAVASRFIARAEGKPVIVGVSNPSLPALADLAARAMDRGAAGVMIAPPGGLRTEEELFGYFGAVFARIGDVPTVLQDFPFSTGVWMSVPSILRRIESFPQIQVVKEEDIPSPAKIARLRQRQGRRVAILTGNNALAGGRVVGQVRHPLGTTDFSSVLLQAQASRAAVVALANSQADLINTLKQAAEFGLARRGQRVLGLAVYIPDIVALGLEATQGAIITDNWYWDLNEGTRAFARRFAERHGGRVPTTLQANVYAAVTHYLKAIDAEGGSTDGRAAVARMKAMPTDDPLFGRGSIRADGRRLSPVYVFQVKAPAESTGRYDAYRLVREVLLEEAYRPLEQGGCPLVAGRRGG
jgi:Periplasmic binding protein/Dihydrodipicolinate synthetase family